MNGLKRILTMSIVAALFSILVACSSGNNVAGTYTKTIDPAELAGNTWHNGFVSATALSQLNTLILNEDGSYEYTKLLTKFDEAGKPIEEEGTAKVTYTFTGQYTSKDNKVTLAPPTDADFDENWGSLAEQGYLTNSSGKASAGDKIVAKEGQEFDPLNVFLTPYYLESGKHDQDVVVIVDKENSSFAHEEVASSEDE